MYIRPNLGFIVEGHCEYESIPSFVGKTLGYFNFPIHNAKGIGNIIKNLENELYIFVKSFKPINIIISLDYLEAEREGYCTDCLDLKNKINNKVTEFFDHQKNGSLELPHNIVVVIADKTFDAWLCSDIEGLKTCELIDESKIDETFVNVDEEIKNPSDWLSRKTKIRIDLKNRRFRKKVASSIRPDVGQNYSRSFRKFIKEVKTNST